MLYFQFKRLNRLSVAIAAIVVVASNAAWAAAPDSLFEALKNAPDPLLVDGRPVPMQPIRRFYQTRGNLPVWTSTDTLGGLNARGRAVVDYLKGAARDGMDPAAYVVPASAARAGTTMEIALSVILLRYAADVGTGRTEPATTDPERRLSGAAADWVDVLRNAATVSDIAEFLETLAPAASEYKALRQALAAYRAIAKNGGWPPLTAPQPIKPGFAGPALATLWNRLRKTDDIDVATPLPDLYKGALVQGVIRFQQRHGLAADGVVGARTLEALNVPVAQRVRQIEINMERWRWMLDDLGDSHVFVNIAGFNLRAVRQGKTVETMPVIIGKPYRKTPVFSDRISYLEINPNWTVPHKIATKDILPKLRADPTYLAKNGFQVLPAGGNGAPVDPAAIDWGRYGPRNFPFQLRQLAGPTNALGQIKFMFPNKFAVYLHDTPARELFRKDVRMFSSGCIRVAQPMALARFLIDGDPAWTPDKLHRDVETGKTKVIRLRKPVPVHLSYLTAWAADDGAVHFRDDVYGRDARLAAALIRR